MAKPATPLTDIQPRNVKAKGKPYMLIDGGGLYWLVNPDGSKYWCMSYRFDGVKRTLAFGTYPDVSLLDARKQREKARGLINEGINPSQAKRIDKELKKVAVANTFEAIAREWHQHKIDTWQPSTAKNAMQRLEIDVFPQIGKRAITEIKVPLVLDMLRLIEKWGAIDIDVENLSANIAARYFVMRLPLGALKPTRYLICVVRLKPYQKGIMQRLRRMIYPNLSAPWKSMKAACSRPRG